MQTIISNNKLPVPNDDSISWLIICLLWSLFSYFGAICQSIHVLIDSPAFGSVAGEHPGLDKSYKRAYKKEIPISD